MTTTADVSILDLIGAEFLAGGRGPAYDCYGLVCEVRRRMGEPLPDYPYPKETAEDAREAARAIALAIASDPRWHPCAPIPGAVLTIRNSPGFANHCGIIVAPGRFLHTLRRIGAHLALLDSPEWRHRITGTYTWTHS